MILSDYVELNPRVALRRDSLVPFVSMDAVTPGTRKVYPVQERPATGSGSRFAPGDTLFARITPCLENGKIAQYAGDRPGMGSTEFFVLRARAGISDSGYVYYFSQSHDLRSAAEKSMSGASGRQRAVIASLSEFECNFPPLPIQRRIAGILSAYDDLIENSQRRIKILESMARAIYREWFVHFRFPGHENHPSVPSPMGEIPEGWAGSIGSIATIRRDGIIPSSFPDEEFEHYSIPAFDNDREPAIELGESILSGKYQIDECMVLLSKLNPRIPRVWLPSVSGQRRAISSTEFLCVVAKSGFTREFVFSKLDSDEFLAEFTGLALGTSTSHQRVRPENLLTLGCIVPDHEVVARFTDVVKPMLALSEMHRLQVRNLRRTRDLLLPRLLSGQIELDDLESA